MNTNEKRDLLVEKALSRKQKNQYSQDVTKRTLIEKGYGDCSGTVWYWYKKLFDINIGTNTEAQINSKLAVRVGLSVTNGVPDESRMKKGDLLYFRGTNDARTEGVGHVEMYIGDGQIFGHGSGIGGTVKSMKDYCLKRQAQKSTAKLKNKGLICVMRFLADDEIKELTSVNDLIWELSHRGIVSNADLWQKTAEADSDIYWLIRKSIHYIRTHEANAKYLMINQLEKNADNVWELSHRKIVSDSALWNKKGADDVNVYWLLRKLAGYIRERDI